MKGWVLGAPETVSVSSVPSVVVACFITQQKVKAHDHWDVWITEADFAAISAAGYVSYDDERYLSIYF